jgi:hypothetical protein
MKLSTQNEVLLSQSQVTLTHSQKHIGLVFLLVHVKVWEIFSEVCMQLIFTDKDLLEEKSIDCASFDDFFQISHKN